MAQLKNVVDPFGEVNVKIAPAGKVRVRATILMEPHKEGAQTGIALDGSGSMADLYGLNSGGPISSVFAERPRGQNVITPIAQKICAYLARKLDADGGTTCIYWATGPAGSRVEEVGDFTADQAERHLFGPPQNFGTGTQLLPAVRYFVERFADAPWGFYIFITDDAIHDMDEVKQYSERLSNMIAKRKRNPLKLVLIGVGREVDEKQLEELDDLETEVDLWDHKLASEIRVLEQIFAEVVESNAIVAPRGRILDNKGTVLKDFSDTGVPAVLEFDAPASATYFTLEVGGYRLHQPLMDGFKAPPREDLIPTAEAVAQPKAEITASKPEITASKPANVPVPIVPVPATSPATKVTEPVAVPKLIPLPKEENTENALDNIDMMEPTLPGLDFKLEFDKDLPGITLDKNEE